MLVAVTIFGGLVREYPLADRMVLFLVPIAALLLAGTMLLSACFGWIAVPLIGLVAATTLSSAAVALARPYAMSGGRQALQYAISHAGPHDLVLIEGSASNLYDFYHQAAGMTVNGNVYLIPHVVRCASLFPYAGNRVAPSLRHRVGRVRRRRAYEPASALQDYVSALGAAGPSRVIKSYPGNSAIIVVDPKGKRDELTSLPAPSWGGREWHRLPELLSLH